MCFTLAKDFLYFIKPSVYKFVLFNSLSLWAFLNQFKVT